MGAILEQLGLDRTFFIQFVVFAVIFFLLANIFFKPFLALFQARHKRTVEDREAAEKMMEQAQSKFDEYKRRLHEEKLSARKEYEALLTDAKKEEAAILAHARNEAKKISQETADSVNAQREQIKKALDADVENIARLISDTVLLRKE